MTVQANRDSFVSFAEEFGRPLFQTLLAAYGHSVGPDATADALAYGWEHWDRIRDQAVNQFHYWPSG